MTKEGRPSRQGLGLLVTSATLAFMLASEPALTIVWDEAYTLARLDRMRAWLQAVRNPQSFARDWDPTTLRPVEDRLRPPRPGEVASREALFTQPTISWFWPFAREEPHGHPAFYAITALLGDALTPWRDELARARLGTTLAFSAAAGAVFAFMKRRWGPLPALATLSAWILHPHLFALGHYATYDGLLASLWLLATLAFARVVDPRHVSKWSDPLPFGVLTGACLATKISGWFLPVPLLVWTLIQRDRNAFQVLVLGGLIAVATLWALNPPFWTDPIGGVSRFVQSNLSRAQTIPIKTMFLGTVYETPRESLPWFNTLFWIVLATPAFFLVLAVLGSVDALRNPLAQPLGLLFLLSAACLLVVRAMPHTPGHDGTRQFAASFGGVAVLAGLGLVRLQNRWPNAARWLLGASVLEAAAGLALMMPVPLAYFSPLVGALPGATRLGMEPTYYWDALTPAALDRLSDQTPEQQTVLFAANPITWFYREQGTLRAGVFPFEGRDYAWYVVQNRPGAMSPVDRALVRRLGDHRAYVLAEKLGVPLVWAFPAVEVEAEFQRMRQGQSGRSSDG